MLDPSDKGSESESMSSNKSQEIKKTCADCGTSKTPLWRGGPAGPKSLCNACGIRSRKKKRDILGLTKPADKKPRSKSSNNHHNNNSNNNRKFLKQRLMVFDHDVLFKRSNVEKQRSRKQLGEEEQAAFLLMALSCGSVYA